MPRYYFDIADGSHDRDEDDVDCVSVNEARQLALKTVPAIVGEQIEKRGDSFAMTINVRNADGDAVYSGTFSFVGSPLPRQR